MKWYLTSVVDPRGNTVAYSYNSDNHVTSIQDAAGRVATLAWDAGANGLLRSVGMSAGGQTRTWSLQYTARTGHQPWLQNVVFPANQDGVQPTLHFEYDLANDNITDIFDPRGADWHYTYGGTTWGTLVVGGVYEPSKTLPANYNYTNPPLNTYDTASPTVFYYASNISGSDLTATAGSYTYTLPSYRMDCAIIDRLGKLWRHEYDYGVDGSQQSGIINNEWLGNPIRKVVQPAVTDYNGNANTLYSDSYTWDYNQGTLTTHIDPAGRKTDFTYDLTPRDNSGLVRTMTRYTGGSAYTWQYGNWYLPGAQPRRVVTNDPDGRRTVTGYNWNYDEATYVDVDPKTDPYDASYSKPTGLHLQTNSTYNAQGELTDVWTGSDPHAVSSNFDAYGNARTVTDPAGGVTTLTFDAWGNKRSQTGPSPLGETDFYYDNLDRLYETDLPDGHRVQAGHDLNGNATSVTKEGGTTVTTAYDGLNRPTSASNPLGDGTTLTTSYGYNLRGERTSVTNPRGYITYYGFDARGKLTLVTYPGNGTNYPATNTRQYAYDGTGNRAYVVNGRGQKTWYSYDGLSRLIYIDYPSSHDVSFAYRIDGVRTQMVDELGTTNYTYDDAGRLKTQAGTFTGKTLTTAYVAGTSRRQSLSDGTQTWTYNYDAGLRPSSLNQTVGSATPVTYNAYYPNGAVQTRTFGNGIKTTFGYDSRGRTKSIVDKDTAGNVLEGQSYAFGPDGNLQTYGHGAWTTAYVHDGADRLTRETRTGGYGANYDCQYAFDGNGNRTSVTRNGNVYPYSPALPNDQFDRGESWVLAGYDADGNPFAADDQYAANGSFAYYFDFDEGNRLRIASGRVSGSYGYDGDGRRVVRSDSQGTSRFVYDGDQVVEVLSASNAVVEYRTPGVGFVRNGAQRYELDSALGSNLDTRDQSGANTGLTEYDAYGREVYQDVFVDRGDFRFGGAHGYVNDDATGWQQLGARLYIPGIGRFLTQDPIGQEGGLNLYAYCGNSPLVNVDPAGTEKRYLYPSELNRLSVATQFFNSTDHAGMSAFYGALISAAPKTFMIDTEIGGAEWRYNTLYLGSPLFDTSPINAERNQNGNIHMTEYENKAWLSSILYHEGIHAMDGETFRLIPGTVGAVERHAWDAQINFLREIQNRLPRGTNRNPGRRGRVGNLIERAQELSSSYHRGL